MEMMKMKVNPLPVLTWHWTGVDDSELKIAFPDDSPEFSLEGQTAGLTWIPDCDPKGGPGGAGSDSDLWSSMETGMGEDFAKSMLRSRTAYLGIPNGCRQQEPVLLNIFAADAEAAGQVLIHAGSGSEVSLVLAIRGDEKNCCARDTTTLQILIQAEKDAHVQIYVVQMLPRMGQSCLNIGGVCQDRATVDLTDLSLGSQKAYIGMALELAGSESAFHGDMGYRVKSSQSVDINYVVRQEGEKSDSSLHAWGVLEEEAKKLFRGTIDFKEGCPGSVGTEQEDVLLLGEKQVNRTIPLILCHEEDVEGNHGATISRLDEQMLFYLGSRGVDQKTAEDMIARARLEALISRIPDAEICREAE